MITCTVQILCLVLLLLLIAAFIECRGVCRYRCACRSGVTIKIVQVGFHVTLTGRDTYTQSHVGW